MTKFIFPLLLSFAITSSLKAQLNSGDILLQGTLSAYINQSDEEFSPYSISTTEVSTTRNNINIAPGIGFVLDNNILVGFGLTYSRTKFTREYFNGFEDVKLEETSSIYYLNPYLTKYKNINESLYFTFNASLLVGLGEKSFDEDNTLEADLFQVRVALSPGLTYFLNEKWAISSSIGSISYSRVSEKISTDLGLSEKPKNVTQSFNMSLRANTFTVGIKYFIK